MDQYVYSYSVQADYAENLLTQPCMQKRGYDFPVPWRNLDALHSASYNDVGVRLFDQSLAQQYGYHIAPNNDPSAEQWREAVSKMSNISKDEDSALVACLTVARKTVPVLPLEAQDATNYSNDAVKKAKQSSPVKKAVAQWRTCMQPLGIADLPDTPDGMPTPTLLKQFGMLGDGASGPISQGEITIATADAKCQDNTGYKAALYAQEWNNQVDIIEADADDLTRVYDQLAKHRKEVMDVIAKHAPSH
ncbi:hypothetical protein [Leifsonia sp. P73]|uniref:hypothetical protein n=1 Tax=Leifsonia sp. P73 TaxID=3423959 RepID=UPI003DA30324